MGEPLDGMTRMLRRLDPRIRAPLPELAALQAGTVSQTEVLASGAQATRNYAKRQFTWFRNQSPPDWRRIEANDYDISRIFASLLRD